MFDTFDCKSCQCHANSSDLFSIENHSNYAPCLSLSPVHLDIQLSFNIPLKTIHATVLTTVVSKPLINFPQTLSLNAVGFLDLVITGVHDYTYDGKLITLIFPVAFDSTIISISYSVSEPVGGLYFEVPNKNYPDRILHCITDHETEKCRYWLPCVDFPSVRTTLDFSLTAPADMTAVANGKLISTTTDGDFKTTKFHCDTPCPSYLICLAVGHFNSIDAKSVNDIPIKYLAPSNIPTDDLTRSFAKTPEMINWIQEKLQYKFPWPKYYQIASNHIGGAMENISLVTWNILYVMDEILFRERGLGVELTNIHEMAHTYFGDLVVIRHFEHVWLKESWATYFEALWLQDKWNENEFRFEMFGNSERYIAETNRYVRPIVTRKYDYSWAMFDSHTYPGGAWRIHMLRVICGDDAFWEGVQLYVKTFSNKVVETDDFRKCLESVSGKNLTRFFEQWFYGLGFPKIKAKFNSHLEKGYVTIELEQTQSSPSLPCFNIDLDLEFTDANGKIYNCTATFLGKKTFATIPIGSSKIKMIRVDPLGKVLHELDFNPGEEILENSAREAGDIVTRIWAFKELIKIGSFSAFKRVKETIPKESFYGVREKVAVALSKSVSPQAYKILGSMLLSEIDPMAMFSIANACSVKNQYLRECLLEFINRKDIPYRAKSAAIYNLSLQKNIDDVSMLISICKDSSLAGQYGIVLSGAIRALGNTRSLDSFEYLLTIVENPGLILERSRQFAMSSLASVAVWLSPNHIKIATEALVLCLSDETEGVRLNAVEGLKTLESKSSIPRILASSVLWDEQSFHVIKRKVRDLRENVGGGTGLTPQKTKEVIKQMEKLEERMLKMEIIENERASVAEITKEKTSV